MSQDPHDPLMKDHNYDGISELDNNLPQWWVWLFVLCCVWALGYMLYFHVMGGPGQIDTYKAEMAAAGKPVIEPGDLAAGGTGDPSAPAPAPAASSGPVYPTEPSDDDALLAQGKDLFMKNCMVCHGPEGGGLIGPNMCDDYFIHGPKYADSIHTIVKGVSAKGMIAWEGVLKPDEIHAVASYVYSLRGTTPANPKPPEGEQAVPGEAEEDAAPAPAAEPAPVTETAAAAAVPAPSNSAYPDAPATDEEILAQGKEIFTKNCLVCHAPDGGGLIGPNMCDDYFIHGPAFSDSIQVIFKGVLAKGMISWEAVLKKDEVFAVASYIYSLRGTTPANPKAPEGEPAPL